MAEQILHSQADRSLVSEGTPDLGEMIRTPGPYEGDRPSKTVGPRGPGVVEIMTGKWKQNGDGGYGKPLAVKGRSGGKKGEVKWE